jgi:alkylation response protein AidB-like acyl-CoA dehydrogenase
LNFDYTEEQRLLAASIRRFVERDYAFEARRTIVRSREGWSRDVWTKLAELGVLGLALPAETGGLGGGAVDLMPVMEAFGDALLVEPFLSTVGLGARFVALGAAPERRMEILPAIAEGRLRLAFAQAERGARYELTRIATRARRTRGGYAIEGEKRVVLHAPCADLLIVSARTAGGEADAHGVSLFIVDAAAPGVTMRRHRTLDGCVAADVTLSNVEVGPDDRVGPEGEALALIEEVVDYATALMCAEAVGAIRCACEATLEYLKARKQFGVPIGSFQALQHRMVDLVIAQEQAQSMASLACSTVDSERDPRSRKRLVSAAKVKIADACRLVAQEAVQLHGGMGMSDEMKVSHTFRRLTVIAQQFGDADHHLERFAATSFETRG